MAEYVLGISALFHDSAAALLRDGRICAAAQEERFTRKKHDTSFPTHAVSYVLDEGGISLDRCSCVVFYEKPYLTFERLLETYHAFAPRGLASFVPAMTAWMKEKLNTRGLVKKHLHAVHKRCPNILFAEHHLSHAASAFFASPFESAAILTIDGVGEWATAMIGRGQCSGIEVMQELHFPHSLGLLYSAFTYYCGFKVNSGEYKLMGLAPYGQEGKKAGEYIEKIKRELVNVRSDGSFLLNMDYFGFATGLRMCNDRKWECLFGIPRRKEEEEIRRDYADLALAAQRVAEEIILKLAATAKRETGCEKIVLAGGVALNCVANAKLLRSGLFKDVWVQPAAGDAGGAVGAALAAWHIYLGRPRAPDEKHDAMQGSFLGPEYGRREIERMISSFDAGATRFESHEALCDAVAKHMAEGKVIGWFQGRMEYGPRALGNRSILADARSPEMQRRLNLKIKFREGFRPFAPAVLEEDIAGYFDLDRPSPYMLFVADVKKERRRQEPAGPAEETMFERLYHPRSDIPAVTHVDYSARVQSVSKTDHPKFWQLIDAYKRLTGCSVIINTSFNVRGEPVVCTPADAYRCFMRTEMDYLVVGEYVFDKSEQKTWTEDGSLRNSFPPD